MKLIESLRIAMLKRVQQFGIDYPLNPPIPKATAHYSEVSTMLTTLATLGGNQDLSNGTLRGTTGEKSDAAEALHNAMRKLARTAKILDKTIYPTIAAEMRLSGLDSYQDILERGRTFAAALEDKVDAFVEYGAPLTIEMDFAAKIAGLEAAINRKSSAHSTRVGSTAGLRAVTRLGLLARRKLDAILSAVYEEDPVLLAAWKSAQRVHKAPVTPAGEPAPTPPPSEPEGSSTTAAVNSTPVEPHGIA